MSLLDVDHASLFWKSVEYHLHGRRIIDHQGTVEIDRQWLDNCALHRALHTLTIPPGTPIVLLARRTLALVGAVMSCIRHKLPFLIIDHGTASSEVRKLLSSLQLQHLYDCEQEAFVGSTHNYGLTLPDAMYLVLSSGSAGPRKCAVVGYQAFHSLVHKMAPFFEQNNIRLSHLHVINGVEFGYFLWDLLLMIYFSTQTTLHLLSEETLLSHFTHTEGHGVSMTPTLLTHLLGTQGGHPRLPEYIFLSGERLNRLHIRELNDEGFLGCHRLFSSYALTETGGQLAMLEVSELTIAEGAAGHLLSGVEINILAPANTGIGQLQIRTDTMATGYLTGEGLIPFAADGYLTTQDLGVLTSDGTLTIVGRVPHKPKRYSGVADLDYLRTHIMSSIDCDEVLVEPFSRLGIDIVVATICATIPSDALLLSKAVLARSDGLRPDLLILTEKVHFSSNGKLQSPFFAAQTRAKSSSSVAEYAMWVNTLLHWMGLDIDPALEDAGLMDLGMTSLQIARLRQVLCVFFEIEVSLTELFGCNSLKTLAAFMGAIQHRRS